MFCCTRFSLLILSRAQLSVYAPWKFPFPNVVNIHKLLSIDSCLRKLNRSESTLRSFWAHKKITGCLFGVLKEKKNSTCQWNVLTCAKKNKIPQLLFMHLYPKSFGTHTCIFVVCKPFQTNSKLKRPTVLSAFKEDILYTTLACWCRLYMSPKWLRFSL